MRRSLLASVVACALAAASCASEGADSAPTPEERLEDWATLPAGTSVPVALGFGAPLSDSAVVAVLERNGLRPYAVYVTAAGVAGSERRDRSRASIELLGEAREQTFAQLRTSLCAQKGRARSLLADSASGADPIPTYREVLSRFLTIQKELPELEGGAPMVYGVEAVGELDEVRAAGSDPAVTTFEPAGRARVERRDTAIVPELPPPGGAAGAMDATIASLTPDEVRTQMARLADDGMGACEDATRPEEPGR